ncbi:hypothetical protein HBB16_06235 [Pseudonocardia sp. MCCB 268]|nr:hypothetical protein [Pseudonocardia cytotoxica]
MGWPRGDFPVRCPVAQGSSVVGSWSPTTRSGPEGPTSSTATTAAEQKGSRITSGHLRCPA